MPHRMSRWSRFSSRSLRNLRRFWRFEMVFRESHLFQGLNISIAGVLDSLRLLLEAFGYGVVTAADGRKGLAAFQKHAPAAVVTDILMPEQDGIGAIREMR